MAVPFTKYEAVLLLDIYLEGERYDTSRYASTKRCSTALRQIAVNQGKKIDSSYRSATGITHQIARMESAYEGRTIMKPATKLFIETVEMYRNNLEEARHMAGSFLEKGASRAVDFNNIGVMTYTKPKFLICFGARYEITSWRSVYITICQYLLENHPTIFAELQANGLSGISGACFADEQHIKLLRAPQKITEDYYVETNLSATAIIKSIKALLDKCSVNYENIIIEYIKNENSSTAQLLSLENKGKDNHMISDNLVSSIQRYYRSGMRFDDTVLRLLEERSGIKIDEELETALRNYMFCRSDGLYFLPEMAGSKEQLALLEQQVILEKVANYSCVDLWALYSDFCTHGTESYLRNEDDLADYLSFVLHKNIRIASTLKTKIIRRTGVSTRETLKQAVGNVVRAIKKSGCITQDDLLLLFPVFSGPFLCELLEKYTDEIVPTNINDFLCYQTVESMGFSSDFSSVLNDTLEEADRLSLFPSQDIIHALLSVRLGYNLRDEFNIPDDKTFRRIISAYYTGNQPRAWKAGSFEEVSDGHV